MVSSENDFIESLDSISCETSIDCDDNDDFNSSQNFVQMSNQDNNIASKNWFEIGYDQCVLLGSQLFDEKTSLKISNESILWWSGSLGIP